MRRIRIGAAGGLLQFCWLRFVMRSRAGAGHGAGANCGGVVRVASVWGFVAAAEGAAREGCGKRGGAVRGAALISRARQRGQLVLEWLGQWPRE